MHIYIYIYSNSIPHFIPTCWRKREGMALHKALWRVSATVFIKFTYV